tara:strand:+ start:101 stop:427 length:327 start_codon:yes stop_codon:yes gene_type:complete
MNGHSDVVGAEEDGTISFNEDTHCYEEIEHPSFDEEKERKAGFFDDDVDGNVQVTIETKIINCQHIIDDMISLNGKKGKSKFGFVNAVGRRNLKRISKLLNEIGELNE